MPEPNLVVVLIRDDGECRTFNVAHPDFDTVAVALELLSSDAVAPTVEMRVGVLALNKVLPEDLMVVFA